MAEVTLAPFARNTAGTPSARRYSLGRGKVLASELDASDDPEGGYENLGNAPSITATVSRQFLDHYSSMSGLRDRDARIPIESGLELGITFEEPTETLGALLLQATRSAYVNPTIAGITERTLVASCVLGRTYPLLNASGLQAHGIAKADLTVKSDGSEIDTVTAAGGRTLTFATAGDTITASSGSFITDGFAVGRKVLVAGTSSNNGVKTITALTATVMTVSENLTDEGPLSSTATIAGTDTTLVEGTDYSAEEKDGTIHLLAAVSAPKLVDGEGVKITLTANPAAESMRQLDVLEEEEVNRALQLYIENARDRQRFLLEIPKATIAPDGAMNFVTAQEITTFSVVVTAVKKDANTPIAWLRPLPPGGVT